MHEPRSSCSVVVLGCSAGGVEALIALLELLPASLSLPLVAVVHLPRDPPAHLVEALAPHARLPVREAEDKLALLPGLTVAPPDYHVLLDVDDAGARVSLAVDPPVCFSRPSIDVLFQSAADAFASAAAGVVLTGANEDGAAGLAAISARGGRCAVQSPDDARVPIMPRAALARSTPELVGTLPQIALWLQQLEKEDRRVSAR